MIMVSMQREFSVHITSAKESGHSFQSEPGMITHQLLSPIENLQDYEVCLRGCVLSPPPSVPVFVCCNFVHASYCDNYKLQIVGVYDHLSHRAFSDYVPVSSNSVSVIRCSLFDTRQSLVPSIDECLLVFHFRPREKARISS